MSEKKSWGTTPSGLELTDEVIEELAAEAEEGFDVDEMLKRRVGRPPIGSGPAAVESVRLDPELRQALGDRAKRDEETTSAVIRAALRSYLAIG